MGFLTKELYLPTSAEIWSGRVDSREPEAQRWHQRVELVDLSIQDIPTAGTDGKSFAFLGFCSDAGVRRNKGRTGAKTGPWEIRKAAAGLPSHFGELTRLVDVGDILCIDDDLENAQGTLAETLAGLFSRGYFPIALGGGHEISYPHFLGLSNALAPGKQLGILNLDAHFDLREPGASGAHSGTGFWQMANASQRLGVPFNYMVLGIEPVSNTRKLFQKADLLGVATVEGSEFVVSNEKQVNKRLENFLNKIDALCLTIDLDVFAAAYAPGVSAPAFRGIVPDGFFYKFLRSLRDSGKLVSIDIAELNPIYDQDNRTARLAASILFEMTLA